MGKSLGAHVTTLRLSLILLMLIDQFFFLGWYICYFLCILEIDN